MVLTDGCQPYLAGFSVENRIISGELVILVVQGLRGRFISPTVCDSFDGVSVCLMSYGIGGRIVSGEVGGCHIFVTGGYWFRQRKKKRRGFSGRMVFS